MRKTCLIAVVALALSGPVQSQSADSLIQGVIGDQIEAFRADDFATAFTFASPMIQSMFGTPENFGRMVQQGYPMVWRPADVRFGGLTERQGRLFQSVVITDVGGRGHLLEYEMIPTGDAWEINGDRFLPQDALGA